MVIEYLSDAELPANWDAPSPSLETQEFGALWVEESRSHILSVPSSILRTERNYVIILHTGTSVSFDFTRLSGSGSTLA
jgi:RES domain-containing protein